MCAHERAAKALPDRRALALFSDNKPGRRSLKDERLRAKAAARLEELLDFDDPGVVAQAAGSVLLGERSSFSAG